MNNRFFLICAFCLASAFSVFAQEIPKDAVPVAKSKVIAELANKKKANPRISARKLADFGNLLLARDGYEFTFSAEQGSVLTNNVDVDGDGFEIYKLTQFDGTNRLFGTREHGSHPCGTWTGLTVTNLSATEMTVTASGKSYRVKMPKELIFDDIELVKKNLKKRSDAGSRRSTQRRKPSRKTAKSFMFPAKLTNFFWESPATDG